MEANLAKRNMISIYRLSMRKKWQRLSELKEADITVVMPQMGVEYQLQPTEEQVALYHKMVEWGADIIFGGHPHVVRRQEILKKMTEKLIIYSMGNFILTQLDRNDGTG